MEQRECRQRYQDSRVIPGPFEQGDGRNDHGEDAFDSKGWHEHWTAELTGTAISDAQRTPCVSGVN